MEQAKLVTPLTLINDATRRGILPERSEAISKKNPHFWGLDDLVG
jgi:hypothetical protein